MLPRLIVLGLIVILSRPADALAETCYAEWRCSGPQCASVMGGYSGRGGPFDSRAACDAWSRKYIRATCTCSSGASPGGGGAGQSYVPGDPGQTAANVMTNIVRSVPAPQNAQQFGMLWSGALTAGVFAALMQGAIEGPGREELARREAVRQEQERIQRETQERLRREALERHRSLLAGLQGYQGSVGNLPLKTEGSAGCATPLCLLKTGEQGGVDVPQFSRGSTLFGQAPSDGSGLQLLKIGDPPAPAGSALQQLANIGSEGALPGARSGFDSASTTLGGLPKPPDEPASRPVRLELEDLGKPGMRPKAEVVRVLAEALEANRGASDLARQEIARLENAPERDAVALQGKREALEQLEKSRRELEDKAKRAETAKEELIDLTIAEAEVAATGAGPAK